MYEILKDSREKVEIEKDGYYFNVMFEDGSIWKSIGHHSIGGIKEAQLLLDRYIYDESKIFTPKQLSLLYFLDPIGVEHYMRTYTNHHRDIYGGKLLVFKDNVYEAIFGVKPRLFRIMSDGKIRYYKYHSPMTSSYRENYYSEAEILFGSQMIDDGLAVEIFTPEISNQALTYLFTNKSEDFINKALGADPYQLLFFAASLTSLYSRRAVDYVNDYISICDGAVAERMFNWVDFIFENLDSRNDSEELVSLYDKNIDIYNKVENDTNYSVVFKLGVIE